MLENAFFEFVSVLHSVNNDEEERANRDKKRKEFSELQADFDR